MKEIIAGDAERFFYRELPDLAPITNDTRSANLHRKFTGSVRINLGKYRTSEEELLAQRQNSVDTASLSNVVL